METAEKTPGVSDRASPRSILFADIAGSTLLYESSGDVAAHRKIAACLDSLRSICVRRGGRVVKTIGDEVLVSFERSGDAFGAACDMQLAFRDWGNIRLRVGFHSGSVVEADGDVFGDTVNLAARVVELSNPGQVLLTEEAFRDLPAAEQRNCRRLYSTPVRGRVGGVTLFEAIYIPDGELTLIQGGRAPEVTRGFRLVLGVGERTWDVAQDAQPVTIGRAPGNVIETAQQTASRHHATITPAQDKFVLTDASSNGTFIRLASGEEYVLRREDFILHSSGAIGLGCPVAQCDADKVLRFELKR